MKPIPGIMLCCFLAASVCITALPAGSTAQTSAEQPRQGRAKSVDIFVPLLYEPAMSWTGRGGSRIDLDAGWGVGYGIGYNFTDYFQVNGILSFSQRDYTASIVNSDNSTGRYENTLDDFTLSLNGVFYFLKGRVAPFVAGGVGFTRIDTHIQTGVATTACWWDPWYGYICGSGVPTKTETDLSYSAGIGVRFDLGARYSLQPSFNRTWIDARSAPGTRDVDVWRIDLMYRVP